MERLIEHLRDFKESRKEKVILVLWWHNEDEFEPAEPIAGIIRCYEEVDWNRAREDVELLKTITKRSIFLTPVPCYDKKN